MSSILFDQRTGSKQPFSSAATAPCHFFGGGIFLTDQVYRVPPLIELEAEVVLSGSLGGRITVDLPASLFGMAMALGCGTVWL